MPASCLARAEEPAPQPQPSPRLPAPMQILNNRTLSCAADLWALGCVVYQMLVGRPPFKTNSGGLGGFGLTQRLAWVPAAPVRGLQLPASLSSGCSNPGALAKRASCSHQGRLPAPKPPGTAPPPPPPTLLLDRAAYCACVSPLCMRMRMEKATYKRHMSESVRVNTCIRKLDGCFYR